MEGGCLRDNPREIFLVIEWFCILILLVVAQICMWWRRAIRTHWISVSYLVFVRCDHWEKLGARCVGPLYRVFATSCKSVIVWNFLWIYSYFKIKSFFKKEQKIPGGRSPVLWMGVGLGLGEKRKVWAETVMVEMERMWVTWTLSNIFCVYKKCMSVAATGMDQEGIMLSKLSQTEKDKHSVLSLICGI